MNINSNQIIATSKYLSFVLRHKPEDIQLQLNEQGWANIDELIEKSAPQRKLTQELIETVVVTSDKQHFKISADGKKIRANFISNSRHLVDADLGLSPSQPPALLYHGTAYRFVKSVMQHALGPNNPYHPKEQQYVQLSCNPASAKSVGRRYGQPVILQIDAKSMVQNGFDFYQSENGLWLTKIVPAQFLKLPD